MTGPQLSDPVVGPPSAGSPWSATLAWSPDQNGGRVSLLTGRTPLGAVFGLLVAGETPEEVAKEFGLQVSAVHVVDQLRRELDDGRAESQVEARRRLGGLDEPDPDGSEDSWPDSPNALIEAAHGLLCNVDGSVQGWRQSDEWVQAADRWMARYDRVVGGPVGEIRRELEYQRDRLQVTDPKRRTLDWAIAMVDRVERESASQRPVPAAGLVRAEHVSGVRVEDPGPSTPLVSPGPLAESTSSAATCDHLADSRGLSSRRLAWSLYLENGRVGSIVTDLETEQFAAGSAETEDEARAIACRRLIESPSGGKGGFHAADLVQACRAAALRPGDVATHLVWAVIDELDRTRSGAPPTDLPATLASVDDVAKVCEAAGLTRAVQQWAYLDDQVHVGIVNGEIGWQVVRRDGCGGQLVCEASDWIPLSGRTLWDAIQAARSAS